MSRLLKNVGLLAAIVNAQMPPAPVLLMTAMSGVLPVLPTATPFAGVETIEGAITYDGPANPGFSGVNGNATVQMNTPGTSFEAVLPPTNFDPLTGSTITGTIIGTVPANGTGVMFTVNFTGFPPEAAYGPFVYHIHELAVPADGNCTSTLSHLDPTDRGEYYPCDVTQPETCQAGDLAGKHGNITMTSFMASYLDLYLSTDPSSPYYFGDKSVVIHSTNATRLTCANFAAVASSNSTSPISTSPGIIATSTATASGTAASVTSYTGAAAAPTAMIGGIMAIIAGAALL